MSARDLLGIAPPIEDKVAQILDAAKVCVPHEASYFLGVLHYAEDAARRAGDPTALAAIMATRAWLRQTANIGGGS